MCLTVVHVGLSEFLSCSSSSQQINPETGVFTRQKTIDLEEGEERNNRSFPSPLIYNSVDKKNVLNKKAELHNKHLIDLIMLQEKFGGYIQQTQN